MNRPLLSMVIVGRNDDYLGNYKYRLQTCLDFLARNLNSLGRAGDVEVIFVDWNSAAAPLHTEIELTPDAARLVRFIIVSPELARRRNSGVSFFTTCAVNVGVRRSNGEFIMLADSDSIMPLPSLAALLDFLASARGDKAQRDKIYPVARHQIPGSVAARRPNVPAWDWMLPRLSSARRKELPGGDCLGGFSAAQLMHRSLWLEHGGYSEQLDRAWGWSDNDLMLRVTQTHGWGDLSYYGVNAYHIEHFASTGSAHQRDPNSINGMIVNYAPNSNPENWGLAGLALEEAQVTGHRAIASAPAWTPLSYEISTEAAYLEACAQEDVDYVVGQTTRIGPADMLEQDPAVLAAVRAAASFICREHPRNVVFFGPPPRPVLLTALLGNPGADIIFARPWREGDAEAQPLTPAALTQNLASSGYRGMARIMSMPCLAALQELGMSGELCGPIECAILTRGAIEDEFAALVPALLDRIAIGGCLVILDNKCRMPTTDAQTEIWLGRILAGGANADANRVFLQVREEHELAAPFDFIRTESAGACIIRKRPGNWAPPV